MESQCSSSIASEECGNTTRPRALDASRTASGPSLPGLVQLSTEKVVERLRFDYWTGAISELMFRLSSSTPDPARFNSRMEGARLEELFLMRIEGSARTSHRTQGTLSAATDFSFHLMGDFRHRSTINWRGTDVWLAPNDLIFTDTRYVHSGRYTEGLFGINIKIPPAWARSWLRNPERMAGRRIRGDVGWGRVLVNYVAQLTPTVILDAPLPTQLLGDNLGAILALVEGDLMNQPPVDNVIERQLGKSIRDVIRQRAPEHGLTASDVADSMRISERKLHRSLATAGQTFGGVLMSCRIEIARRMLASAHLGRLTTGEIGNRAGFSDPSHFVRAMTRALGVSPRRYREAIRTTA